MNSMGVGGVGACAQVGAIEREEKKIPKKKP
jgi:hypothetical protein